MIKTFILLWLVLSIVSVDFVECRGGGGRGGGRGGGGRGGSRGGHSGHGSGSFGGWLKGLFGGGSSSSHTYPASTGLSGRGSGGSHGYPASNGLSGTGAGQRQGYPASTGLSGSNKYGQRYRQPYVQSVPTYYTAPQHVYVTQYRDSGSRYNTLLTGLTLYNMGRMNSYHNHYYYHDSYHRRGSSSSDSASSQSTTGTDKASDADEATCVMRIKEIEKEDVLKIPCAIVTTFVEGKHRSPDTVSEISTTLCVNSSVENTSNYSNNDSDYGSPRSQVICNLTINATDPLLVQGPPLKPDFFMECIVEIVTKDDVISNEVDCETLMKYAKLPVPQNQESIIMPPRNKLKDMLDNPPWWLSLFIIV